MKLLSTPLEGLFVIEPKIFSDARGFFVETYNEKIFSDSGLITHWKQDNWSRSQRGSLRGLHFQKDPHAQAKLVRVVSGSVFDVAVDIRPHSSTYGKWFGVELNEDNKKAMYIPTGFAHGFVALSDNTDFFYKCSALYSPESEGGYLWNDPSFDIRWPLSKDELIISAKDLKYLPFKLEK